MKIKQMGRDESMDRIAKLKIGCIFFVLAVGVGLAVFLGVVEYSRQQLLVENLEKGKAMLAEQDYQSARIYLSLFEEKGNTEIGFNLYNYVSAVIAYQTYLGTGDINQIQLASDYLSAIDMSKLSDYTGKAQELKSKVEEDLTAYKQLAEMQEQATAAAQAAEEAKNPPPKEAAKSSGNTTASREKEEKPKQAAPASEKPSKNTQEPKSVSAAPAAVVPEASVPPKAMASDKK